MAHLSDIHLSILPATSLGLVQAEVAFDAGFNKQELTQKQAYTLSIGLFGTWDSSGSPSPEPLGSFFADRARGYSEQPHHMQRNQPMPYRPGGPNWGGGGAWNGMPGYPPGPPQHGYGDPGFGYPQPYIQGPGYPPHYFIHPQHRPYPQGYSMQRHPGYGYGPGYGQAPYQQPYPQQFYGNNGSHSFELQGFEPPMHGQAMYAPQPQAEAHIHANGYSNGTNGNAVNQTNGRNTQQQHRQPVQANPQAPTAEAPEAETAAPQPRLAAPEYFVTWIGRELLVPTLPQLNLQRRCLFDPRETPFPFFRAYVWLIPDRMDGRGWSLPSANPVMAPQQGSYPTDY
jgi:hypothetical protein